MHRFILALAVLAFTCLLLPATAGAVCPCSSAAGFDNFCHHAPSTAGCSMTWPGGYCDPNGDASYTDADWVRGYNEYRGQYPNGCNASESCPCSSAAGFDNFCHHAPSTPGCGMTWPGGYCDPNGDASYSDADWVRGYYDYQDSFPSGCGSTPPPSPSCSCSGGSDYWGNAINPASTYCGYTVCGGDNQNYECTSTGWASRGGSPCAGSPTSCTCTGGTDYWGHAIDPASTYCGLDVCGADNQIYECTTSGWQSRGGSPCATPSPSCRCTNGSDYWGNAINPDSTYCGYTVCGGDNQQYRCDPDGWQAIGGSPCADGGPRNLNCFGLAINANGPPVSAPTVAQLQALGVRWVRTIVYAGNWEMVRNLGEALNQANINLIVVFNSQSFVDTLCETDRFQIPGNCFWYAYQDQFADNLLSFANSYDDYVDAYELWNEPDLTDVPSNAFPDLIRQGSAALRTVSSKPVILSGPAGQNWLDYFDEILFELETDATLAYDGVAVHPYGKRLAGVPAYPQGQTMESAIDDVLNLMSRPVPLWITEFGVPLVDLQSFGDPAAVQADYLSAAYTLFGQYSEDEVAHAFWFAWSDYVQDSVNGGGRMGLIDVDLERRLAWDAYKACATDSCVLDSSQLTAMGGRLDCPCPAWDTTVDNVCAYPMVEACASLQQPACAETPINWQEGYYQLAQYCSAP